MQTVMLTFFSVSYIQEAGQDVTSHLLWLQVVGFLSYDVHE